MCSTNLYLVLQKIKHAKPKGYFHEGTMSPLKIYDESVEFPSFNACLDNYLTKAVAKKKSEVRMSKFENEKKKLESILRRQKLQIKGFEESLEDNQKKAELLYENYTKVQKILDGLKKARQDHSWKEIKDMLKDKKMVKNINEKNNEIIIDL